MSALRKIVSSNMFHMKNVMRNGVRAPVARYASTLLDSKEKGEEARYIRRAEAAKAEEIRANLERIMALEDSNNEKAQLVELLEHKKETGGFLEKYNLNKWNIALPVVILTVLPAIEAEYMLVDADMMITGCFFLVCGTVYNQFGGVIDNFFKEQAQEEERQLKAVDDAMLSQIQSGIDASAETLDIKEDLNSLYKVKHDLKLVEAEVLTAMEQHKYRDAIVAKLESLQVLEDGAVREIRARMISKVHADVLNTFKTDKKAKENALNQAIAVLAGGAAAKYGKDVVGEVFSQSLVQYKEDYAKQPEGSDPVLKKLAEEIAVIAKAPVVDAKGGNVYTLEAVVKAH